MNEAYDKGTEAAMYGKQVWENPYSTWELGQPGYLKFHAWFAGWCLGMQVLNKQSKIKEA